MANHHGWHNHGYYYGWQDGGRGDAGHGGENATAHLGPIPLRGEGGTLTSEDRAHIYQQTRCSASVRWRQQWQQRCLTINGPPENLSEARRLADAAIRANGTEGGRHQDPATMAAALQQENTQMKARVAALELTATQLWTTATSAIQVAKEAKEKVESLTESLERLQKKQKKRDERRVVKEKRKAAKTTSSDEPEEPAVKEEPSSDEEKPVEDTPVDEKVDHEAAPSGSQEQKDEKMEEDPASSLVKKDDKNEKIGQEALSPTSVPCF